MQEEGKRFIEGIGAFDFISQKTLLPGKKDEEEQGRREGCGEGFDWGGFLPRGRA